MILSALAEIVAALLAVRVVGPSGSRWFGPPAVVAGLASFAALITGSSPVAVAIIALTFAVLTTLVGRLVGAAYPRDEAAAAAIERAIDPEGTIAALRRRIGRQRGGL